MYRHPRGRRPKLREGDLTPEWEETLKGAYDAGAGRGTISEDDEDLQDAARLATPLGDGILWHPSTLADIHATPNKVLILFDLYRFGMGSRMDPGTW